MRFAITLATVLMTLSLSAQQYITRQGQLTFDAGSPLEDIVATSKSASAVYDASSGKLGVQVLMTSFAFKRALMQEHFNENYVESERFPKAVFKGIYKEGRAIGGLTIHGVTQEVDVPATLVERDGRMELNTQFSVKIGDYDIAIPKAVADKIDPEAKINVHCTLHPRS